MDFMLSLLNALPGAVGQGLMWGIMAIGVYITYRVLDIADLTVDGSLGNRRSRLCAAHGQRRERLAGHADSDAGRHARRTRHRTVPHQMRHPGHPRRHTHPARALFRQPAHHGLGHHGRDAGHPGRQRGQIRPARLLPLRPGAGACKQPDTAAGDHRRRGGRPALLVLRHRDRLRASAPPAPTGNMARAQGINTDAQRRHRADDLQRHGRPSPAALHRPVPGQLHRGHGPRRHRHRPCGRHHRRGASSATGSATSPGSWPAASSARYSTTLSSRWCSASGSTPTTSSCSRRSSSRCSSQSRIGRASSCPAAASGRKARRK